MDSVVFELPSEKSTRLANDACNELIVNGGAENGDGNGYSFYPFWSSRSDWWEPTVNEEVASNGAVNHFFRANRRKWHSDSIRTTLPTACFVKGLVYTVSLRLRIFYHTPLSYYVQLTGPRADGSGWTYKQPLFCPAQSESDGWVTCSGPMVIDADYEVLSEIHYEIIMDYVKDKDPWAIVDYDDISIAFKSGPAEGLKVDGSVVSRWGVNSDLHITSSTLSNRDSQNAVIDSVQANADGSATIKLKTGIDAVISEADAPGQGVEVALLSRNIKIVGQAGGTASQGGYFQVFHTPGVAQIIEGVEFTNMGQQQGKNRFALQFLYSGDVSSTSVSR